MLRAPLAERFERMVVPEPNSGCWLWLGTWSSKGYGQIRRPGAKGGVAQAHAVAWELHSGKRVPKGMVVCHRCDNPPCVNPAHLFVGTHKDNSDDKERKGRGNRPRGSTHYAAVFSDKSVAEIRLRYAAGETGVALANAFGVCQSTIYHITSRRTWKHM
jgi:hypothetical protein